MPRIKVVWIQTRDLEYDEVRTVVGTSGDWQEATLEQIQRLSQYLYLTNTQRGRPYIIEEEVRPVQELLADIDRALAAQEARRMREERERLARQKTRTKTEKERKRKQLEKLKREFGET